MTPRHIQETLDELTQKMGLNLKSSVTQDEQVYLVNLEGSDARHFSQSKDNKSGALVIIAKLILKQKHGEEPKIILDFNGERKQRIENVVAMARKKAEMVRLSGQEEEMPPMSPAERRAVHMELKTMTGIKTESRGVEPHRRIVIVADDEA